MSPSAARRVRMLAGRVSEFDIPTVMQVASMGRQYTEVDIFGSDRALIGTICVKSGKVVSARAGAIEGTAAIRELLGSKSFEFTMYRTGSVDHVDDGEPLGSVSDILIRAANSQAMMFPEEESPTNPKTVDMRPPAPSSPERSRMQIMAGNLSDFNVPSLLKAVNLGRQQFLLEVLDGDRLVGAVAIKGGMVLRATARLEGKVAVQKLAESPGEHRFVMWHLSTRLDDVAPVGSLESVLVTATPTSSSDRPSAIDVPSVPPRLSRNMRRWIGAAATLLATLSGGGALVTHHHASSNPPVSTTTKATAPAPMVSMVPAPVVTAAPVATVLPTLVGKTYDPEVAAAQAALKKLGFDPGPVDGLAGPLTAAGVRAFQNAEHLNVDGELTSETRSALQSVLYLSGALKP